jgi:hypothetical protein
MEGEEDGLGREVASARRAVAPAAHDPGLQAAPVEDVRQDVWALVQGLELGEGGLLQAGGRVTPCFGGQSLAADCAVARWRLLAVFLCLQGAVLLARDNGGDESQVVECIYAINLWADPRWRRRAPLAFSRRGFLGRSFPPAGGTLGKGELCPRTGRGAVSPPANRIAAGRASITRRGGSGAR